MKQIKILLSSALTLLLITGNNTSYAAPHYTDFNGDRFQGKKPGMNTFKGQVRKGNVRKGNVFTAPRSLRLKDSGKVEVRNTQQNWGYRVNERGGSNKDVGSWTVDGNLFKPNPNKDVGSWTLDGSNLRNKLGGQEGEAFNPTSKYSISDEPAFIPKPNRGKFNPTSKYSISDRSTPPAFIPKPDAVGKAGFIAGPIGSSPETLGATDGGMNQTNNFDEMIELREGNNVFNATGSGGNLSLKYKGEVFNPTSKYSISDEPAFIPKPDGALGPDVVTTLEHGPGIADNAHDLPQGVPLKFINGEWK